MATRIPASRALARSRKRSLHDYIGMEEIDDGIWNIVYYNTVVGRLNRKTGKITGHDKV
jgi:hypothetical protein